MDGETDVAVVGGGPAGLMAAIAAGRRGRRVTVFERLADPGRKLLASGGGRCNLTTATHPETWPVAFGRCGRFIVPALAVLGPEAIRAFFLREGVPTVVQADDACVFPRSQRAADVLAALRLAAERVGARLVCGERVERLTQAPGGRITGVIAAGRPTRAHAVVLAAGGCAYPALGSDGSGLALAREAGLTVVGPVPALVPLVTAETWPHALSGIVLERARIRLAGKGEDKAGRVGPLLFTHRGISGPPVLNLSREVSARLDCGAPGVVLLVAAHADRDAVAWRRRFDEWGARLGRRACHNVLSGEMPRALAEALCAQSGLMNVPLAQAGRKRLEALAACCGGAALTVTATDGWNRAMVTRGGVALDDLDPRTLACRRVPGLFCAGELVDLDGPCGGYNLTWAFASGWLAGLSA
ncbi:MAG: aminoacetone oxidase family FAD-binding enzyme [Lentisphaerae bacterium]|nr:aminoacetone oxidase family FAD-binding enzyme [Lentisphaerota bacterium]